MAHTIESRQSPGLHSDGQHGLVGRRDEISQQDFFRDYKDTATPVILSDLTSLWPAREKWTMSYLKDKAGDQIVPLYSSQPARDKQHQHAAATHLPLREYIDLLQAGENDLRLFFYNLLQQVPSLSDDFEYPELGLKYFKRLSVLFMGGRGSRVQMHYDIDLADLVLCHFGGRKRVLLVPPEQTQFMYKVPYSFSALHTVDFEHPDLETYPALQHVKGFWADLKHGDALYIPPGFWHYVVYEDIGFSMTLRAFPTSFANRATMLNNIFVTRTIEGLMRKLNGQKWNDRNERLAVQRTHQFLANLR